ncbi:hypothetical protein WAI453_004825 [Rhynchosporium graminicola]
MNSLMHDLEALLLIKDGEIEWLKEGSSKMDYQMHRLRHSFSKRGTRTVEYLKSHNGTLRELLDSSEELCGMKAKRKDTSTSSWLVVPMCSAYRFAPARAEKVWRLELELQSGFRNPSDNANDWTLQTRLKLASESSVRTFKPNRALSSTCYLDPLSISVSTLPPASSHASFKSKFRKTSSNGTEYLVGDELTRTLSKPSRLKTRKQTRFDAPITFPALPLSQPAIPVSQPVPAIQVLEIKDFCSLISSQVLSKQCLGFLSDGEHRHDVLPFPTDVILESEAYISLSDILLNEGSRRLSSQKRFRLATILASSLLQLQTTPWLLGNFEKKDIFFQCHGDDVSFDYPYFRHSFTSLPQNLSSSLNTAQSDIELRRAARTSLEKLGILLLELTSGQPIEVQDIRKRYLVDGKPHTGTDYMTAREWVDLVWEEDPRLEPIIRSCLFCPFEEKPDWRNKLFTQAVYANVVGPLDDYFLSKWP